MFISMRSILFIGGLNSDKTVFALVNEDQTKTKKVHLFQSTEPVCSILRASPHLTSIQALPIMQGIQKAFMTFKTLEAGRARAEGVVSPTPPSPELEEVMGTFAVQV
jgi:hypothetical protein